LKFNYLNIINISNKIKIKMTNLNKNHKKAFSLVEISIVILIIGLLIAGISKASDMIFDANIATGRSITKSSKVNRMPSLVLWLETTLAESIKDSERGQGSTLTAWRDINPQSTTKFIFRGNGAPTYVDPGKNLPAIGSLSASNFFTLGTETSTTVLSYPVNEIFNTANATIFMVLKTKNVSADLFSFCVTAGCAAGKKISLGLDAGKLNFVFPSATDASATATTTLDYNSVSPNVIIVSAEKDSAGQKIAVNGANALSSTTANTSALLPASFSTATGTFKIGGVAATDVEIYEIIVFSTALGDGDRRSVEAYLGKKYNTTMAQGVVL
jgi:prepilin-type N-terminal cleavage/methylation domain-containing protein